MYEVVFTDMNGQVGTPSTFDTEEEANAYRERIRERQRPGEDAYVRKAGSGE